MTPERRRRIEELYRAALERPEEQRAAFLDEACAGDQELRREVESLLGHEQAEDSLLDRTQETPAETGSRLAAGAQLGPYRIEAFVGAGGMGEVYRATDTRLGRTVAIKLLRTRLTDRADGRQRFQREARAISSLSHPHICSLYDVGEREGTDYLVMEYVEGETLEARLRKGKPPLKTALRYGMEIADAVAAAHARGIVHRDLKPGNVMITSGGVKLLDFGLAKVLRGDQPGAPRAVTESLTETGAVVGTLAYMAPEQIEGKECDARSDIFALGLMLYEMLTGRRAGLAAILKEEPAPLELRPPMPRLEDLIRACLAKDPAERWQSAADVKRALGWVLEEKPVAPRSGLGRWWAAGAAVALVVALALWGWIGFRQPEAELRSFRFTLTPPPGTEFSAYGGPAISPDGRQVAFVGVTAGTARLWIQALDSFSARELRGTERGQYPFWAPDNRTIGFFADDQLKTIGVAGGPPRVICPAAPRGGAWNANGDILLATSLRGPLMRVPASGGTPVPVTKLDNAADPDASHRWPQFLPDGRRFIYFYRTLTGTSAVYLGSLDRPQEAIRLVDTDYQARFVPGRGRWPDCLVWWRGSSLVAQRFDAERARLTGEAVSLAEDVSVDRSKGWANFSVSTDGTLVYETPPVNRYQLAWFSREGKRLGTLAQPDAWRTPRISPDGKRVALTRQEPSGFDVWQIEIARGVPTRLTFGGASTSPVWSPDGRRIAYGVMRHLNFDVYQRSTGGGGEEERLTDAPGTRIPVDWSPDGRFLLVTAPVDATWRGELGVVPLDGDHKPVALFRTPSQSGTAGGKFSPDGRWVAYYSDESGRFEVYLRSFPAGDVKLQVSAHGGRIPRWRRDGKELYYIAADGNLMAVPMRWSVKAPELGAENVVLRSVSGAYDVTPDGQRFLMLEPAGTPEPAVLRVLFNWQAGLKR